MHEANVDGIVFPRYPKAPEVGDMVEVNGESRKLISVTIDPVAGRFICETQPRANIGNTKAPVVVDGPAPEKTKANKSRQRRKSSRS